MEIARWQLRARGYGPDLNAMQAIGYREAGECLDGHKGPDEAREATLAATRRYARRQRTWFRAEPVREWLPADDPARALDRALALLDP